ncbi:MCE family protein [Mycobacterium sp.]|uniref:MCE family protein n=1 Tax=Mycobacterium sp. TaxID=1785 RepID=UPI002DA30841|nr:MCE family protein [Mycobacterium sp.]
MSKFMKSRTVLAIVLIATLIAGVAMVWHHADDARRTTITAYFANSNGIFVGDDIRILGIPVGKISKIEPLPGRARITFWFDDQYDVPADAKAVIISPTLISARAIQLTPAYTGGPALASGAVIQEDRTAVPIEWDDLREQLEKLALTLQPAQPGGVAPAGEFINVAADNLRGNGEAVRDTLVKLSQAASVLGDHSSDIFTVVRNLALLVSALQGSSHLMSDLNVNLAAVTNLLTNSPGEISNAVAALSQASSDLSRFVADNREPLGTTVDHLTAITTAINESNYDLKQILHITPTQLANYVNIYQPAQGTVTGALAFNNFADPIQFICGAVEAASRLGAEQSAKLCVQYLAPIIKNRQFNTLPFGLNPLVGAVARPNEITYSEDRLRPDYVPPAAPPGAPSAAVAAVSPAEPGVPVTPLPAEAPFPPVPTPTDPAAGLPGLMVPAGAGS